MEEEKGEGEKIRWAFYLGVLVLFALISTGVVFVAFHIFTYGNIRTMMVQVAIVVVAGAFYTLWLWRRN